MDLLETACGSVRQSFGFQDAKCRFFKPHVDLSEALLGVSPRVDWDFLIALG